MAYIISVTKANEFLGYVSWNSDEFLPRLTSQPGHAVQFSSLSGANDWFALNLDNLLFSANTQQPSDEQFDRHFMSYSVILEDA